jgi:hypothetical protein
MVFDAASSSFASLVASHRRFYTVMIVYEVLRGGEGGGQISHESADLLGGCGVLDAGSRFTQVSDPLFVKPLGLISSPS